MTLDLPPKVATIQFDVDGDILLLLSSSEGSARFQVSSNALCLASPVFRAMLGAKSKFKESKDLQEQKGSESPLEITLSDDDPKALAIILRIIHHQLGYVPALLAEENLWEIAILVDKYDLGDTAKIWANLWVKPYLTSESSYFAGDRGISLAYVLNNEDLFKRISKDIILTWVCTPDIPQLHPGASTTAASFQFVPQFIVSIYIFL